MTTWTFPADLVPHSTEWQAVANSSALVSPLNGATQTIQRPGSRWGVRVTFRQLDSATRRELMGFLVRMNGLEHRMLFHDHAYSRGGAGGGTPLVNGASQTGRELTIDGCTPSTANWLKSGDFFKVGSQLLMMERDADADAGGNATLAFWPALRFNPANNAPISIDPPLSGTFMLADPSVSWSNIPGNFSSFSFDLIEDVLA